VSVKVVLELGWQCPSPSYTAMLCILCTVSQRCTEVSVPVSQRCTEVSVLARPSHTPGRWKLQPSSLTRLLFYVLYN
jgi:hypothetical protein